jgi:hypothetical protein
LAPPLGQEEPDHAARAGQDKLWQTVAPLNG